MVKAAAPLGPCAFRLERDLQARARRLGVTLQRAGGGLRSPTFQPGNHGLGRLHALRHLLLCQTGARARLDACGDQGELLFQRFVFVPVLGVVQPLFMQVVYTDAAHHSVTSLARFNARTISARGVFRLFFTNTRTTTTRRPFAVMYIALDMPSLPLMRISHKGPSRCFTSVRGSVRDQLDCHAQFAIVAVSTSSS